MKKILAVSALLGLAIGNLGCIGAPVIPLGLIYTDVDAPLTLGPSRAIGLRRGEASITSVLFLFSIGDGSVRAAALDGGIRDVERVEYRFLNVLGIFQRYTTIAYGN